MLSLLLYIWWFDFEINALGSEEGGDSGCRSTVDMWSAWSVFGDIEKEEERVRFKNGAM